VGDRLADAIANGLIDTDLGRDLTEVLEISVSSAEDWVKRGQDEGHDEGTKLVTKILARSKRLQEETKRRDPQTGFYNSVYFRNEFMPGFLKKLATDRRSLLDRRDDLIAFWYLDFDGLKFINDLLGHKAGDELFKRLSYVLRKKVRGDEIEVGRLGGIADEFGVLQMRAKNLEEIYRYAERVKRKFRDHRWVEVDPEFVKHAPDISIGVAVVRSHSLRGCQEDTNWMLLADEWRELAEKLMYISKTSKDVIMRGYECVNGAFVPAELPDARRMSATINRT
jgi:diguanylate cyclase (GGDEF)-like protein